MTLLELLVKELPGRGGWPDGATIAWQSGIDGEIYFCGDEGSRVKYSKLRLGWSSDLGFEAGVTREQYEAAIAAQQPVWNGEGLPPVGCECEFNAHDRGWEKGTILYVSEYTILLRTDRTGDPEEVFDPGVVKLLPIRTEADRNRDLAVGAMERSWESVTGVPAHDFEKIYDDIAAGKIPGVELSK